MTNASELKTQIVKCLSPMSPEKIILFGSYAYGNPTEDSDLDLCIVERHFKSRIEEKRKIRRLLKGIRLAKDILVAKLDEFSFYKNEINSVTTKLILKALCFGRKAETISNSL